MIQYICKYMYIYAYITEGKIYCFRIWYIYNEFYLVIRKNEIMSVIIKWMELEIIMLSKISHIRTNTVCFLSQEESQYFFKGMSVEGEPFGKSKGAEEG